MLARINICLCLALLAGGCKPQPVGPVADEPRPREQWVCLTDGNCMAGWRVLQGNARSDTGAIALLASSGQKSTILAEGTRMKNGVVEVVVRHREGWDALGPYTIALRVKRSLNWSSLYFVCRPESLEICRGSRFNPIPSPQIAAQFERSDGPERWRFILADTRVECFRFDRKVLSYTDAEPVEGVLAITSDGCDMDVLSVWYSSAEEAVK